MTVAYVQSTVESAVYADKELVSKKLIYIDDIQEGIGIRHKIHEHVFDFAVLSAFPICVEYDYHRRYLKICGHWCANLGTNCCVCDNEPIKFTCLICETAPTCR